MKDDFEKVDWSKELQSLVAQASTAEEKRAAFAFANAINPYLEKPELLKTLLGKIMQSPSRTIAVVASKGEFESLREVRDSVGKSVSVIPL
jgi:hypothetical protein